MKYYLKRGYTGPRVLRRILSVHPISEKPPRAEYRLECGHRRDDLRRARIQVHMFLYMRTGVGGRIKCYKCSDEKAREMRHDAR